MKGYLAGFDASWRISVRPYPPMVMDGELRTWSCQDCPTRAVLAPGYAVPTWHVHQHSDDRGPLEVIWMVDR